MTRDLDRIRKLIIQAVVSDDELMNELVLKGGNDLSIVHHIYARTSLDIDFSLKGDFKDRAAIERKIIGALESRFDTEGYQVFDAKFSLRPGSQSKRSEWGGYQVEFKLILKKDFTDSEGNLRSNRVSSIPVGDAKNSRAFTIQISKNEWVDDFLLLDLDGVWLKVYSLPMIAAEKLRALCQQMEEYPNIQSKLKRPRARDFFDIFQIDQKQPLLF